jgi:hypothetical protein
MLRLQSSPSEVAEALVTVAAWSTEFDFCTPAVDSRLGQWPLWRQLLPDRRRVRHAFVGVDAIRSEPHALEHLHRLGVLRLVPTADGSFRPHLFRFRRGEQVRILTGAGALVPDGMMAPLEAVTLWEGDELGQYAVEAERLFARAKQLAHVPEPEELEKYAMMYFDAAPHRDSLTEIGASLIRRTAFDGEMVDLELVSGARTVRDAMTVVKEQLTAAATMKTRQTVGYHGGSATETVHWSTPLGIWSLFKKLENRYWNCFGVERPDASKSLRITVEVNPPLDGSDRKMGGAIAHEPGSGKQYLVHRGRIGGGQKGIGAELFWSRFRGGVQMREPGREDVTRVVIVGEIGVPSFPRDVAAFVHEVGRIKRVLPYSERLPRSGRFT